MLNRSPPSPNSTLTGSLFTPDEVLAFQRDGYAIVRGLGDVATCDVMREVTRRGLTEDPGPAEFEADVHYPGSPTSRDAEGGQTVRRLKEALARHPVFTQWLASREVSGRIQQLLGPQVVVPLAHHNCIMTKQPRFSSDTLWHQDVRYWSFQRPDLINVWLALGRERPENGCLSVLPGTHIMEFRRDRLDSALFLRPDLPENQPLIAEAVTAELNAGDVLLFHARTFHAAGRNRTAEPKFSVVFTFRAADNPPIPGSRSAAMPELLMPVHVGQAFQPDQSGWKA
jgi:phytanoyl-CoA hydroxylase